MKGLLIPLVLFFSMVMCHSQNVIDIKKKKFLHSDFITRVDILRNPFETDSVIYDPNFGFTDYFLIGNFKEKKDFIKYYKKGIFFTSDSSIQHADLAVLHQLLREKNISEHTNFCKYCNELYLDKNINGLRNGDYKLKYWCKTTSKQITPEVLDSFSLSRYWQYLFSIYCLDNKSSLSSLQINMKLFYIPLGKIWLEIPNYKAKNKNNLFIRKKVKAFFITDIGEVNFVIYE